MNAEHKFSFVKTSAFIQRTKQIVHLKKNDQMIFCNYELNDYFQFKYFPTGKYNKITKNGVKNDYIFEPAANSVSQYLCQ